MYHKIIPVSLLALLASLTCKAQFGVPEQSDSLHVTTDRNYKPEPGYSLVKVLPSFDGGIADNFSYWVAKELIYPVDAKRNGIQGRVLIRFTVDKAGWVKDVSVIRGVCLSLDAEAVRVVSSSPRWTPGRDTDGKPMPWIYTFPVIFQLQ